MILSNMVDLKLFFLLTLFISAVLNEKESMRAFQVRQKRDTESLGTGGLVAIVLGICMACCSSCCCIACCWISTRQREQKMQRRLPADYNLQNPPIPPTPPSLPPMLGVDLLSASDRVHESSTFPSKKD